MKRFCFFILIFTCNFSKSFDSLSTIFSHIYEQKLWGANALGQGYSGSGSKIETTQEYRELLEMLLATLEIKSVVDLGCGDWEFSRAIPWGKINYRGFDVVPAVICENIRKYTKENINFGLLDATQQELPPADLLICKDVLQHLSNQDIQNITPQFAKYKYCLITNDVNPHTLSSDNPDIVSGDHRFLDLTQPPFNLKGCKLLVYKSEYVTKQVFLIIN